MVNDTSKQVKQKKNVEKTDVLSAQAALSDMQMRLTAQYWCSLGLELKVGLKESGQVSLPAN